MDVSTNESKRNDDIKAYMTLSEQFFLSNLKLHSIEKYHQPLIDLGFNSIKSLTVYSPAKLDSIISEKIINNNDFENEYHFACDFDVFKLIEIQRKSNEDDSEAPSEIRML